MNQLIRKRDLSQVNPRAYVTLNQGQMAMNSSIQYAVSSKDSNQNPSQYHSIASTTITSW
jgi:hypothetical protein